MSDTHARHILLLGAGFSRNWGGWLADEVGNYLLTCPEVKTNHALRSALTRHANFEAALSELQTTYLQSRSIEAKRNVDDLQNAVLRMFRTMDQGFRDTQFEFQSDGGYMVRTFLNRFDAIFTLNQDYLLERHYLNDNVMLASGGRWQQVSHPGARGGRQAHKGGRKCARVSRETHWIPG